MDEKSKRNGGSITEEAVSSLLQRYSVKTVLKLLKEVAISAGQKIDWNAIVKNTATGISNAREYQMLWRHLAYGQTLIDQIDDSAIPLDDDSDLEYEVEPFPAVSRESSVEAAACVKVLVASDYPIDHHVPNNSTVEAPLTINVPMFKAPSDSSLPANAMHGANIIIPVSVQKEPLSSSTSGAKRPRDGKPGVDVPPLQKRKIWSAEDDLKTKRPRDGKPGVDVPAPQKRKIWSTEDDLKLTAAVQKHGEQKWANIASEDFKNDRTPAELSLRWATIRKKRGNLNAGTSAELSEARKAATRAILLALEPRGNNLKAARPMSNVGEKTTQHESQMAYAPQSDPQVGTAGPPKPQVLTERSQMNSSSSPTSMIKVAAVAAGACIATPADASSVNEVAARSQNVVYIRTGNSSSTRPSTTTMSNQLSGNNFSRNGPTKAPVSAYASTVPNLQLGVAKDKQGSSIKPMELVGQSNPVRTTVFLDRSSVNATTSTPNKIVETAEVAGFSTSASEMKEPVQRDRVAGEDNIHLKAAVELISENQLGSIGNMSKPEVDKCASASGNTHTQGDQTSISLSHPVNQPQDDGVALPCSEVEDNGKKHGATVSSGKEFHDPTSSKGKHADLSCKSLNGSGEGSTINTIAIAGDEANN